MNEINIRQSTEKDFSDVMNVEKLAFGMDKEAELVSDLLKDKTAEPVLSLLAFDDDKAVGHILFTKCTLENSEDQPSIYILAPLAVIPEYQKKGIGGKLIKEGLQVLKEFDAELVFVLGHMEYYPKYGFIPDAKKLGYEAPYFIPEKFADAWMVQAIGKNQFDVAQGKIKCADALNKPEHWRE